MKELFRFKSDFNLSIYKLRDNFMKFYYLIKTIEKKEYYEIDEVQNKSNKQKYFIKVINLDGIINYYKSEYLKKISIIMK